MSRLLSKLQDTWRKNWPEVRCGLTGGLPGFIFNRDPQPFDPGVPVFCYHVVGHDTFRADLAFLKDNGYATLGADELLEHLESRKPAPPRSVVLSFDDGQETLHTVAYPLLIEFGFKAVAFICPGLHREPDDAGAQPHGGLCDWQQIRQMHDGGHIDFQAHTDSHRYVPDWPRPLPLSGVSNEVADLRRPPAAEMAEDLRRAKQALENRLGKTVQHMAFPQYDGTESAIHIACDVGYQGLWWGVLPGRPLNRPKGPPDHIVRISGEFVRRMPGDGRAKLRDLARARYGGRP